MTKIRTSIVIAVSLLILSVVFIGSAAAQTATRTVPSDCIDVGGMVTITIDPPAAGVVIETLCDSWTYVDSSLDEFQVIDLGGNQVSFTVLDANSFTYRIQAPDSTDVCCTISGIYRDIDDADHSIEDDTVCTCSDTNGQGTATRTVPSDCIDVGGMVTITIDPPAAGVVIETLCDSWTYVDSSLDEFQVIDLGGNQVSFTVLDANSFTYRIQAPDSTDVCCTISGIYRDIDDADHSIEDDTICVCTPTDPPTVDVTSPNGGEVWCTTQTIKANAADTDGTIVNVEFLCSPDGGVSWVHLNTDGSAPYEYAWDTTSVSNGTNYLIKAIATDNNSATAMDTSDGTFTIQNPCPGVPLCEGWNLFSVPRVLSNDSVEYVLDGVDDVEAIIGYDASAQNWYIPTDITPLTAFAIKMNASGIIANLEYMPGVPPSRQMYEGWNLVGLTGMVQQDAEFTFGLGGIDDNYSKVWGPWDCEIGDYGDYAQHGYNKNVDNPIGFVEIGTYVYTENYIMNPYEGHWIKMTDDAILEAIG